MKVNIGEIDPFSSLAYPGKTSTVIYFQGCNLKCPWCWTHEYLDPINGEEKETTQIVKEIKEGPTDTQAVVIDGGEPTQQPKALKELCEKLNKEGYKIQINTNGTKPNIIEEIGIQEKVHRIGLDVKAPLEFQRRYTKTIGKKTKKKYIKGIKQILRVSNLCEYKLEPRTTVIPGLTDSKHWIGKIAKTIGTYTDTYTLQAFTSEKGTLNPDYQEKEKVKREELLDLAREAGRYVEHIKIRTIDSGTEQLS